MERAQAVTARRDAAESRQEERERGAREAASADRAERTATIARQLGLEPGAMSQAAQKLGDAQAEAAGLRDQLERAEKKVATAERNMEYINRMMAAATEAANGQPVAGELPASRHAREVAAELTRAARASWYEG